MLRASTRVLGTALFSALGLSPLACGGAFSGVDDDDGSSGSGGSSTAGSKSSGGKSSGGSKSSGGGNTGGSKPSGGSASGGATSTGGTPTSAGSGGGTAAPCDDPMPVGAGYERCGPDGPVHRPRVEQCESSLPRPSARIIAPPGDGQCLSDADCTDMPHGYCTEGGQLPGGFCAYGCVKDSECPSGNICVCGDPVGHCVSSTCTSNADCGAGLRCQSYDPSHGCGMESFACQTPDDTCESDADCQDTGSLAYCDASSGAFTCVPGGCAIGRPFLVLGEERLAAGVRRADWSDALAPELLDVPEEVRRAAARAWLRVGRMEHASIAAFARFALQLLSLGAPPRLVEAATQAMADETRHARLAFGLASHYAGERLGPGPLDIESSLLETSLVDVVRLVVREGCIGETAAALEAREAADRARDARLGELLRGVADDEASHAELAWRFVAWALEQEPQEVAEVVRRELLRAACPPRQAYAPAGVESSLEEHGILSDAARRELQAEALRHVIAPCAEALLARAGQPLPDNPVLSV